MRGGGERVGEPFCLVLGWGGVGALGPLDKRSTTERGRDHSLGSLIFKFVF